MLIKLKQLHNKKIAILGLGIENQAWLNFVLHQGIKADFHIYDSRSQADLQSRLNSLPSQKNIKLFLSDNQNDLSNYDLLLRSPGFPLFRDNIQIARDQGVEISSAMKMFFAWCPSKNIIGVTGSKGKGTTASLIQAILEQAGQVSFLGGNIGVAPFTFIDQLHQDDYVVLELSSFQLEDLTVSPHIAVITNLTEEHLQAADLQNPNYHATMDDYARAKFNIVRYQLKEDYCILNEKFKDRALFFDRGKKNNFGQGKRIYFSQINWPSKLIGNYNKENIAAAVAVGKVLGIKINDMKKTIINFRGLSHRIEFVKEVGGVKYYDNSFATTPEATSEDLDSFIEPIILFLGGADKGSSFVNLAKNIVKKNIKFIVLLAGEATGRIQRELLAVGFPSHKIVLAKSMLTAVDLAQKQAVAGDIVLLSTACASFGMFNNYKERGDLFQQAVKKI